MAHPVSLAHSTMVLASAMPDELTHIRHDRLYADQCYFAEPETMNTLQQLFDRLAGIAHYETAIRVKAQKIYSAPTINLTPLERPACWRRPARIQTRRRA